MIKRCFNENWIFTTNGKETLVTLPHDAMLHGSRSKNGKSKSGCAYFEGGFYTYTKTFLASEDWKDKDIFLEVEGAYRYSKVYINNTFIKENKYGYTGYMVSLSDYLEYGHMNTITIECDNVDVPNSRWYSGAGLYRDVNLYIGNKSHFNFEDIVITTTSVNPVTMEYTAPYVGDESLTVEIQIIDGEEIIASTTGATGTLTFPATPWSPENPKQYTISFTLSKGEVIVDEYTLSYGFRTLSYTLNGLYINGEKTILKGCCLHHDNGILGAVSIYDAEVKKLTTLKSAGYNAIRSAHNPASKALLQACDDLGILVMDEYADIWYNPKNPYDYSLDFKENWKIDIEAMVKKDINHPCVVLYSLGNELSEPNEADGLKYLEEMVEMIHQMDPTRKTTMGINFTNLIRPELDLHKKKYRMYEFYGNAESLVPDFNRVANAIGDAMGEVSLAPDSERESLEAFKRMDIAGYNYAYMRYEWDSKNHPDRMIVGTESMCADVLKIKRIIDKHPQILGDFMWTGYDYIGEVGIGGYLDSYPYFEKPYPWILANGGAFDLLGVPTGEALLASITYGDRKVRLATRMPIDGEIQSAWRYTNSRETYTYSEKGRKVIAEVYTLYPRVELFLNGKTLGEKKVADGYVTYEFPYEPGTLKAVAVDGENQETAILESIEGASHLSIRKEYSKDITYLYVEYKDKKGRVDSTRLDELQASIQGGEILGFGSANPITEDDYTKGFCHAWQGMAMLAVRKTEKNCTITVKSDSEVVNLTL